jgi:DNA repair protein RecO (recombination protein O)
MQDDHSRELLPDSNESESHRTSDHEEDRRTRLYRLRCIVLRRRDLGETDRIVTVFSAEHGKRRVVAKGSRRPGSRLAGHLEPFCATRLLVARTRGLDIVSQAETIESFAGLRRNETAIATAGYFAELVDALMPDDQAQEAVFDILYASYGLLSEARDPRIVSRIFEMAFLHQAGYRPELSQCTICGEDIEPVVSGFSPEGGVVCHRCMQRHPGVIPISVNAIKLLRAADRGEMERLFRLRVPQHVWDEVETALSRYIARLIGRESSAQRVLGELRLE